MCVQRNRLHLCVGIYNGVQTFFRPVASYTFVQFYSSIKHNILKGIYNCVCKLTV